MNKTWTNGIQSHRLTFKQLQSSTQSHGKSKRPAAFSDVTALTVRAVPSSDTEGDTACVKYIKLLLESFLVPFSSRRFSDTKAD